MLRRKIVGDSSASTAADSLDRQSRMSARNKILLSRQEKRALRSLRLLEKVESIGLDNMMPSTTTSRGISPLALQSSSPAFSGVRNRTASPMAQLTSLKPGSRYGGATNTSSSNVSTDDELDNINQRTSTIRSALRHSGLSSDSLHGLSLGTSAAAMLAASDSECSTTSSVNPSKHAHLQQQQPRPNTLTDAESTMPTAPSGGDSRVKQIQRQKSRRAIGSGGQRPDLGTVAGKVRPDLGRVSSGATASPSRRTVRHQSSSEEAKAAQPPPITQQQQTMTQSFVGTISSLFFGRKGGLL